ncbi:metallophosphoesterase family protein [Rheinheimera baltica]|uniref:metallophosphoesterase family protein n=2 Tax=Rheinheimera baltica TaxID=67576 RepID=UPI001F0AE18E|nr:metallophosphoesterase [Rheinheimera baltica]
MRRPGLYESGVGIRLMVYQFSNKARYRLAQITDCHLLANVNGYYQQVQPAMHLAAIVEQLILEQPDAVLLTGDVTQDHSVASYQLLARLLAPLSCPIFCLPGNHDDTAELARLCQHPPFRAERSLQLGDWQLLLLNTKGDTPAGAFSEAEQRWLQTQCEQSTASALWLFCHHHPKALNCFIDKHGQLQAQALWQAIAAEPRVLGIAHGHAHYAYHQVHQRVDIVGCPASSVQFLPTADWQTVDLGPQWCDWVFSADQGVSWQFRHLEIMVKHNNE